LHKSKLQLHHRKHVLHLRAHRRLAPVLRPLHFVNTMLVAVAPMGAVLGLRRALPDHFALSAISLIAPHARFLAVRSGSTAESAVWTLFVLLSTPTSAFIQNYHRLRF